jgi:hypothetical protein
MTTTWIAVDKHFEPQWLGFLPDILLEEDERPVKEQLEDRYAHGGGWRPIPGLKLNRMTMVMRFPGDPPYKPAAFTQIGKETVVYYPMCSLLLILQANGDYEVTRVD